MYSYYNNNKNMTTLNKCYSDSTKIIDVAALGHVLNPIELRETAHVVEFTHFIRTNSVTLCNTRI